MNKKWLKNIGPGPLLAAAFIGPGTVTVCTLAGVNFGFTLLWAMFLSVLATVVLQEMSARLGIVSQKGLSEVIRTQIRNPFVKIIAITLILSAILVGNAAYEAGNISGSVLGLETIWTNPKLSFGVLDLNAFSILIGGIAFALLYVGNYKILERVLISLVVLMSLAFLITAILTKPNLSQLISGLFLPKVTSGNILTIIALVGTTVVPYNIFLHASLVKEKWSSHSDIVIARRDTVVAVVLGGVVSMCIIVSAAAIKASEVSSAADLAKGLEPLFGAYARYLLAIGLFAAGITSAVTAPLAAAYVTTNCLGWSSSMKSKSFKVIWMSVLILGVVFS